MRRSLNFTGRRRIPADAIDVVLRGNGSHACFDVAFRFPRGLPPDARLFIEAYRRMEWMRFDFGTVETPREPADRRLTRFASTEGVLFRLRVVAAGGDPAGRLIGEADGVMARADGLDGRTSLLPLQPSSLQGEPFRLQLDDDRPVLLVESTLGSDWTAVAASPFFQSFVYPGVLRSVLHRLLEEDWPDPEDDGWRSDWARFASQIPGFVDPSSVDGQEREDWVDALVGSFCRSGRLLQQFNSWFERGES